MAKKAMCVSCNKGTIALFDGMLMSFKRKDLSFTISGKDAGVHISCPYCKTANFIAIETNEAGEKEFKASGKVEEHTYKEEENKNNEEDKNNEENKSEENGDGEKEQEGEGDKPVDNFGIEL